MRRSSVVLVITSVASATALATVAAPAAAVPGPGSHSAWAVHQDALGEQSAQDWTLPSGGSVVASGNDRHVRVYGTGGFGWSAEFTAPEGRTLSPGETFEVSRSDALDSDTDPGLAVSHEDRRCGADDSITDPEDRVLSLGRFTVQQAVYDGAGHPVQFAVTFEQNCQDTSMPSWEGSLAASAADPAAPVPAPSPTPGPVTGATISNHAGPTNAGHPDVHLAWTNPSDSAWAETVVGATNWEPLPTRIGGPDLLYRGSASTYSNSDYEGISQFWYRLVPVSELGRWGETTIVSLAGTRLSSDVTPGRLVMGQQASVEGRLQEDGGADPMSGPGLANRRVDIYRRPKGVGSLPYTFVRRTTTRADGRFAVDVTPLENSWYTAVFPGSGTHFANSSTVPLTINVAPQVDLAAGDRDVRRRSVITFTTARKTTGSRSVVLLQRLRNHRWTTVATKRIRPGARAGKRVLIRYRAPARGHHAFRLVKPGDANHVNGVSRTVRVKVR